ncbi:hypothetical protein [Streptomyces sp. NPDC001139]
MLRHAAAPRPYWPQRRGSGLIASRFDLRHRRADQQSDYDEVFLDWTFCWYPGTVELTNRGQYECVTNLGFAACPLTGRLRVTGDVPAPAPASARHSAERFKRLGAH